MFLAPKILNNKYLFSLFIHNIPHISIKINIIFNHTNNKNQ
jgi:hypothetical protein